MSGRSNNEEHERRIQELAFLLHTGCSSQVSELIMIAKYQVSREAARQYRIKAQKIEGEPIKQDVNYASMINRISISIESTLIDYTKETDPEKSESRARSLEKLIKVLEKLSALSNTYIIDSSQNNYI